MSFDIAIVFEGPTDYIVVQNIVCGITGDKGIELNPLMPRTVTGKVDASDMGNWNKVLKYCASEEFRGAFDFSDFVIIQIDTDQHDPAHFNIPSHENGQETTSERKYEIAKRILISWIGEPFYEEVKEQVVFAICIDCIECWLLPLHFPSDKVKRLKTKNCFETLIRHPNARTLVKDYQMYQSLSKPLTKKKVIETSAAHQMSLARFVADAEECLRRIAFGVMNGVSED